MQTCDHHPNMRPEEGEGVLPGFRPSREPSIGPAAQPAQPRRTDHPGPRHAHSPGAGLCMHIYEIDILMHCFFYKLHAYAKFLPHKT